MKKDVDHYLILAEALPEVFLKVAETKRILQSGEASTVRSAVQQTGISRSVFYKYKDAVFPFSDLAANRIITMHAILKHNKGALSQLLELFSVYGANILTINQSVPTNGCAAVTVSAEVSDVSEDLNALFAAVLAQENVVSAEILAM